MSRLEDEMDDVEKKKGVPRADWEAIEREFRACQFSNREIGRRFGVTEAAIRKHAKQSGWKKCLADVVREEVREQVACGARANMTDDEVVSWAADRGTQIVEGHLARAARLTRIADKLMDVLEQIERGEKPAFNPIVGKGDCLAALIRVCGDTVDKMANLERRALNLDESRNDENQVWIVEV